VTKKSQLLMTCAVFLIGGCYRDVDFKFTNPLKIPQSVTLQEYDNSRAPSGSPIYTGSINPVSDLDYPIRRVRVGHYFDVSGQAGYTTKITVVDGSGPQVVPVTLPAPTGIFTDASSAQQLLNAFQIIGPSTGFPPMDLNNALQTAIGAVKCYTQPTENQPFSSVVWQKPPGIMSDIVPLPNPFPFPAGFSSNTAQATSTASANIAVSVPVYAALKAQFTSSGLDKYTIRYQNFGVMNKVENNATFKGIPYALNNLSEADKQALINVMASNKQGAAPRVVCTYFNSYYVMQSLIMDIEHSTQVSSAANVSATTVFTADGAYNFGSGSTQQATLTDKVLNVWGDNFTVSKDPSSTATNTVLSYNPVLPGLIPSGAGAAAAAR
jgi:hypothetical protein